MGKKRIDNSTVDTQAGIISFPLDELMGDRFGRYAKYIIQERALPDVRDGLKPVQRRILYAMHELHLTYDKPYKKSARVVGEVIGKYHPHGDTSIYDAMVRMSQAWKLNMPLIDMQGNNGSIDGDSAAAMRYTETRLSHISNLLLADLTKNTVPFTPNFDDSEKEPIVLPAYFPNILVNGSTGIAAGYATNMPPHNLGEVIDATIKVIKTPHVKIETLLEIVKGPDFPTGGIVQGRNGIKDAFLTGKGKVMVHAKWHQEHNNIIIDEIPYEVVKQDLVRKIGEVIDANPGLGILEVRDETDRNGLRIAIDLSDKANLETVRKFLFKSTPLAIAYNYNNVVIVDLQPKQLGMLGLINAYIKHYKQVFSLKCQFDLAKAQTRLEIIVGLIKAMDVLDQVIQLIRQSTNRSDAIGRLVEQLTFSIAQATAIVDMRLYRLTATDMVKLQTEQADLTLLITQLEAILASQQVLEATIIERLKTVKKQFAIPRKSIVENQIENLDVEHKAVIMEKQFNLWISKDGYLKAIETHLVNRNDPKVFGRKPNDLWIGSGVVSNLAHLILITNRGTYYSLPLYKLPISKWREIGVHVNTIATMPADEHLISGFIVSNFDEVAQHILLTTKNGAIKRTPLQDLATKIYNKAFRVMKVAGDDQLVSAQLVTSKTYTVAIITQRGYGVSYNIEDVPVQGTNSKGVKAANLSNDHIVAGLALTAEDSIVFLTDKAGIKKLKPALLPIYVRPKRGVRVLPERKRGFEAIMFAYQVNFGQDQAITVLDAHDQQVEVAISKYHHVELTSQSGDFEVKNIIGATMQHLYLTTSHDTPPSSLNASDDHEGYISRSQMRDKQAAHKGKVSTKITINPTIKAASAKRVAAIGSGFEDLLGDISSALDNLHVKKPEPAEQIELNFEDLFNEEEI